MASTPPPATLAQGHPASACTPLRTTCSLPPASGATPCLGPTLFPASALSTHSVLANWSTPGFKLPCTPRGRDDPGGLTRQLQPAFWAPWWLAPASQPHIQCLPPPLADRWGPREGNPLPETLQCASDPGSRQAQEHSHLSLMSSQRGDEQFLWGVTMPPPAGVVAGRRVVRLAWGQCGLVGSFTTHWSAATSQLEMTSPLGSTQSSRVSLLQVPVWARRPALNPPGLAIRPAGRAPGPLRPSAPPAQPPC